jgi:hypothetical protein
MTKNMGKGDRIFRLILGVIIIAVGIYYQSWWGIVGLILLITAMINWCPLYVPFKLSTRKPE